MPPGTPAMVIERLLDALSANEIVPVRLLPTLPVIEDAVIVGPDRLVTVPPAVVGGGVGAAAAGDLLTREFSRAVTFGVPSPVGKS